MTSMKSRIIAYLVATFASFSVAVSQDSPEEPDALVAQAAALYGSTEFTESAEQSAIRLLARALTADPANAEAKALIEAIQQRREERDEQRQQEGQEHLDQQQDGAGDRTPQTGTPEDERDTDSADDRDRPDAHEDDRIEHPPAEDPSSSPQDRDEPEHEMTPDEAIRLLNALEEQEKVFQTKPRQSGESEGPRW